MKKLILGITLLIATSANAAIINFNETTSSRLDDAYLVTGENTHLDTTTGLEWLDFGTHDGNGVTFGYSINNMVATYYDYGFRLATETEISNLFSFFYTDLTPSTTNNGNGTYTVGEDPNLTIIQERNSWLVGFGTHEQTTGSEYGQNLASLGLYEDDDGSIQFAGFNISLVEGAISTTFYSTDYAVNGLTRDSAYANLGVFMVLDSDRGLCNPDFEECGPVVPIPAAIWLFGTGLVALLAFARRKA